MSQTKLSLRYRRWLEVRFYHWCSELYQIRYDLLDVVLAVEALSQLGEYVNIQRIKNLAGTFLSDPYYKSNQEELIVLAHQEGGLSYQKIADHIGKSKRWMVELQKRLSKDPNLLLYPKLEEEDAILIEEFFKKVDLLKTIGL